MSGLTAEKALVPSRSRGITANGSRYLRLLPVDRQARDRYDFASMNPSDDPTEPALTDPSAVHTLLIHGGSHGAWCWRRVETELRRRGVLSSSFDLPGCGQDRTPRARLTMNDLVASVIDHINELGVRRVRLVGHSIGGWLLPPVAAEIAARVDAGSTSDEQGDEARDIEIAEIVFVGASILRRGECGLDVTPAQRRPGYYIMAESSNDNSLLPDFESAWGRFFQHLPEPHARAFYAMLTPQAFGPYLSPAAVGIEDVSVPRRYIAMDDDRTYPLDVARGFAAKAGVEPIVIAGDHCVMLSDATALAAVIVQAR